MPAKAVTLTPAPQSPRQLGEEGLVIFWRDGRETGRREGIVCAQSVCLHPDCGCQIVNLRVSPIDELARSVILG